MKCPVCEAWTSVKETRTRKTDGVVTRRYECANLHRFSTEERIRDDEPLQRLREPEPKTYVATFSALDMETRSTVDTATAAHYLNYSRQTLLRWACEGSGPIQPNRAEGARKLQWPVADIRKLIGEI